MKTSALVRVLNLVAAASAASSSSDDSSDSSPPLHRDSGSSPQIPLDYRAACPDYAQYARRRHPPLSDGPLELPYQRPDPRCRTFTSPAVEDVIREVTSRMVDKDLARIFENAFPNTLDTTVRWHVNGSEADGGRGGGGKDGKATKKGKKKKKKSSSSSAWSLARLGFGSDESTEPWHGAQSFIVTGDINAEWLRDSTNQLAQYQPLARRDPALRSLILGAIATQAEFLSEHPYCNAFQPPPPSGLSPTPNGGDDVVHPAYEPAAVFECKYELDSAAHFLALGNAFFAHTRDASFLTGRWLAALDALLALLAAQSRPTFDPDTGAYDANAYRFQRRTTLGTETLSLAGVGNPLAPGTGLVRSAFRPSDDATIFGFFIPANAMMAVELARTAEFLRSDEAAAMKLPRAAGVDPAALAGQLEALSARIRAGVMEHGVVKHAEYGEVFAFEVDGYGSRLLMDDANLPSLLSLPLLGFCARDDPVYLNTRRMVLARAGNPYFLESGGGGGGGSRRGGFSGIGGPHVGLRHAWPMSVLVQAMTAVAGAEGEKEARELLERVKGASRLGLVHEGVNVENVADYTRKYFALSFPFPPPHSPFRPFCDFLHPPCVFGRGERRKLERRG